jgi:hypothetical protein
MIFQRELIKQRRLCLLLWSHHRQIPRFYRGIESAKGLQINKSFSTELAVSVVRHKGADTGHSLRPEWVTALRDKTGFRCTVTNGRSPRITTEFIEVARTKQPNETTFQCLKIFAETGGEGSLMVPEVMSGVYLTRHGSPDALE